MALKPGEKKEIKIDHLKIKLKKCQALREKANDLRHRINSLGFIKSVSNDFKKSIVVFKKALNDEIDNIKAELEQLEKMDINPNLKIIANKIRKECSEFIAVYAKTGRVLYRGSNGPNIFLGKPIVNREPMDSEVMPQRLFDIGLKKSGITAGRSNSIFTTSSYGFAEGYGSKVFMIFPKNGSTFSYSTIVGDMVLNSFTMADMLDSKMLDAFDNKVQMHLKKIFKPNPKKLYLDYDDDFMSIRDALYDENMKKYQQFLIKIKFPGAEKFNVENFVDAQKVVKKFGIRNTNLEWPLNKGNEVLIYGEYYSIEVSIGKSFLPLLGITLAPKFAQDIEEY